MSGSGGTCGLFVSYFLQSLKVASSFAARPYVKVHMTRMHVADLCEGGNDVFVLLCMRMRLQPD